jgi:hypothetical protein
MSRSSTLAATRPASTHPPHPRTSDRPRRRGAIATEARADRGAWVGWLAVLTVALAGATHGDANTSNDPPPPPCPPLIELPCNSPEEGDGSPATPMVACQAGEGTWVQEREHHGFPTPQVQSFETYTVGWTRWGRSMLARHEPNRVVVGAGLSGQSIFMGGGSQALAIAGSFSTVDADVWRGAPPPAPRLVQLAAEGFASMSISVTCAAIVGCSAGGAVSVSGMCSSLGNASADLPGRSLVAAAAYDAIIQRTRIEGRIGMPIPDSGPSFEGSISAEHSISVHGTGVASGSASYQVRPDRTYCAFTNRPVVRRAMGNATTSLSASVSAGHAAASSVASVYMAVR